MSEAERAPFAPARGGAVGVHLPKDARAMLRELASSFRRLLTEHTPSSDVSLQRLFPPAYPDDPLQNLDFEREAGRGLLDQRLEALDLLIGTADAKRLTIDEAMAWMRALNDMRLVFGSRLNVTEETEPGDFDAADEARTFELYLLLGWLLETLIAALGEPDAVAPRST
jgi:hypothetical protein